VDAHHARDLKTHVHLTVGQHTGGACAWQSHCCWWPLTMIQTVWLTASFSNLRCVA
jgi:hypothetical protein